MSPFHPPWVTVALDRGELERFLADPGERQAAGAVELRLDLWPQVPSPTELAGLGVPTIVTWRAGDPERESERTYTLRTVLESSVGEAQAQIWVDLDHQDPLLESELPEGGAVILSDHRSEASDDAVIETRIHELRQRGARAVKVVLPGNGLVSLRQALRLAEPDRGFPVAVFAGGVQGTASRILGPGHGSAWSYGRLAGSPGTDPGQPPTRQLTRYGEVGGTGPTGCRYAIIGRDVRRALSPGFHNRLLARSGVEGAVFLDVSLESPEGALDADPQLHFSGFAVTAPHKPWARTTARPGDPEQADYPAWNTLRREPDGSWTGFNTDAPAVAGLLRDAGLEPGQRAVILGGGGAALALAVELRRDGIEPCLWMRRDEAARDIERRHEVSTSTGAGLENAAAIVNATGAGRGEGDPLPWSFDSFPEGGIAFEMSYEPERTAFLAALEARGARSIGGAAMFAEQARLQAELLYGITISAPDAACLTAEALAELAADPPPEISIAG